MNPVTAPRTACLLVPDLPLYAEQRAHPELKNSLWAVACRSGPRAEILSVSKPAHAAGLRATLSVTQARSICPDLEVRVASPTLQRAARQTLLDLALSVSLSIDVSVTTCPEELYELEAEGTSAYSIKLAGDGTSTWYYSESGNEFGTGYHANNVMNFVSPTQCKFF